MKTQILAIHAQPFSTVPLESISEACLALSPLVEGRALETSSGNLIFIDLTKSFPLFKSIQSINDKLTQILHILKVKASWAYHFTPAQAQVACLASPGSVNLDLVQLPISYFLSAEGLRPFKNKNHIELLLENLQAFGFTKIGDFAQISSTSISQRWGEEGYSLKRKMLGLYPEVVSAYEPFPIFLEKTFFDFGCSLLTIFLEELKVLLTRLEVRLLGCGFWAHEMILEITYEFSGLQDKIHLRPALPSSDPQMWLKLFEQKLVKKYFENPIREIKLQAHASSRQSHQLDFWTQIENDDEKLLPLINLFSTTLGSQHVGFAQLQNSHVPEKGWTLLPVHTMQNSLQHLLSGTPRPTRLLPTPLPMSQFEVSQLHFMADPSERIEAEWWNSRQDISRDYYMARRKNQILWIFYDHKQEKFFLHGYFD